MTVISNLPDYVERGGQQVWRPPARASQVELYGFVAPADQGAIDALLLRDLVRPSAGAVDYRCAHPNVVVTFGSIGREASLDPVDSRRGYIREREVSIWCLVADVAARGRLLWYMPYIFTDSEQTVATGREIFGYPKQLGYFDSDFLQELGPDGGRTSVSALAIDPFGPDEEAVKREMISVVAKPRGADALDPEQLRDELALFFYPHGFEVDTKLSYREPRKPSAAIAQHGMGPPAAGGSLAPWARGVLSAIQGRSLTGDPTDLIVDMVNNPTLVFLKQFRDVSCATKACYQAVIEAPLVFDPGGASYEALDPGEFELRIQNWASDPIADELGTAANEPLPLQRAFHAKLGFDIDLGVEVWRAPT